MANYLPPTENLPIFDNSVFTSNDSVLTESVAAKTYLKFPTAQGNETLQSITVAGTSTFIDDATFNNRTYLDGGADVGAILEVNSDISLSGDILMGGVANTNYLEFPDGTKQYTAASGAITGNLNLPANLIFDTANAYIQFGDNTKQYTAAAGSSYFFNEVLYIYKTGMTAGSLDVYMLNFNTPKTYVMSNTGGAPLGYNLSLIGGGGASGANVNNPTSPVVGSTYTQRLGGSGGSGGVITTAYRFTGSYATNQNAILSLYSYPNFLPVNYDVSAPLFSGQCTAASGSNRLTLFGTATTGDGTYVKFISAPVGSVVVCTPTTTARPWFLTAIINSVVSTSATTGYYELGFPSDQTIAGTTFNYKVYSSATNKSYQGSGLCTYSSGTNAYTLTLTSLTFGAVPEVGDWFFSYKTSTANGCWGYVTAVSGSVPTLTLTITQPMNFGSTGNAGNTWYSFKGGYQGPSYYASFLAASALGQSAGIVGMAFGGRGGTNATSSAVGTFGLAGTCLSSNSTNTTVGGTTGTVGGSGTTNSAIYALPYTTTAQQTTQTQNSRISGTTEPTTQISSLANGGYSSLSTTGVVTTFKPSYGGINIAYLN